MATVFAFQSVALAAMRRSASNVMCRRYRIAMHASAGMNRHARLSSQEAGDKAICATDPFGES